MPRVLLPQLTGQIFRQREQMVLDFYVNILSFGLYSVSKHLMKMGSMSEILELCLVKCVGN